MSQAPRWSAVGRRRRAAGRGFTLVELLVVIAVITILAGMVMPSMLRGLSAATTADCVSRLRQIATANVSYSKDYEMTMVCAGDGTGEHTEGWIWPPLKSGAESYSPVADFPYWYQALAAHQNIDLQLFACPAKEGIALGYGYHYTAPYGTSLLYRDDNKDVHKHFWPWSTADYQPGGEVNVSYHPVDNKGNPSPVKVLWYRQCAPYGSLASPSSQIGFCDTGLVVNDTELTTPPPDWREDMSPNVKGYVRFPLCEEYVNDDRYKGAGDHPDKAWRPVPRHGEKAVCAFLDGSARALPIQDVVGPRWFDAACQFDNRPQDRPPTKKVWQN